MTAKSRPRARAKVPEPVTSAPRARGLSRGAVRRRYFANALGNVARLLTRLEKLTAPGDHKRTPDDVNAAILDTIASIAKLAPETARHARGSAFPAALYALAGAQKPLLGPLLSRFSFAPEERVQLLAQFVQRGTKRRPPVLDLSRQELTSIPEEISDVPIEEDDIGGPGDVQPYKEINLGYNPLRRLSARDFARLSRFEGIHLIGLPQRKLSPDVALLKSAVMLNFSWSDLVELPPEVYSLRHLRFLKLNWTSIATLSRDIKKLRRLQELELAETPLLETLRDLEDGDVPRDATSREAAKLRMLLSEMGCQIRG